MSRLQRACAILAVLCSAAGIRADDVNTRRLVVSSDGSIAVRLGEDGKPIALGLPVTPRIEGEIAGAELADIALSRDGSRLYGLLNAADGKRMELVALSLPGGARVARWEARGHGLILALAQDQSRACIMGLRSGSRAGARRDRADEWLLTVVDLRGGGISSPLRMDVSPRAAVIRNADASGPDPRLLVAARDRIATFTLDPPGSSWFFRSPGSNEDLTAPDGSSAVHLLRDGAYVEIDPTHMSREQGRVQLTDDDATRVVELQEPGGSLSISRDGHLAAVLAASGRSISVIDAVEGALLFTRTLAAPAEAISGAIVGPPDPRVIVATTAAGGGLASVRLAETPSPPPAEPAKPVAAAESKPTKPAEPVVEPAAPEPSTPPPPPPAPEQPPEPPPDPTPTPWLPAQPTPPPPDSKAAPQPSPAPPPPPPDPQAVPRPSEEPPPRAAEPVPPEPPAPAAPAGPPALSGRITGDLGAVAEVRLYGPDNIAKLHSRAPIGPDGAFRLPVPPDDGTYRLVVSPRPDRHVFMAPPFLTLRIRTDGTEMSGLDFEVRGELNE